MLRNKILVLAFAGIILSAIGIGSASAATFTTPLNTDVEFNQNMMKVVYWEGNYPADETISASSGATLTLHNHFHNLISEAVNTYSWTKSASGSWLQAGSHGLIYSQGTTYGDNSRSIATGSGNGKQFNDYHEYIGPGGSYASTVFANLKYNVV